MKKLINSLSFEETEKLGKSVAALIKEGGVIALYGDLGSGKTTFTRGFAEYFGVKENVSSPSFVLQKEYHVDQKKYSIKKIYHLDLYRLSEYDKDQIGIADIVNEDNAISIIEWADKLKNSLPNKRIDVYFDYISDGERMIKVEDRRYE